MTAHRHLVHDTQTNRMRRHWSGGGVSNQNGRVVPIFDGHNDTVLSLRSTGRSFFDRSETGHVDLPRAKTGGMAGGFFAVWVPDPGLEPPPGEQPDPDV